MKKESWEKCSYYVSKKLCKNYIADEVIICSGYIQTTQDPKNKTKEAACLRCLNRGFPKEIEERQDKELKEFREQNKDKL